MGCYSSTPFLTVYVYYIWNPLLKTELTYVPWHCTFSAVLTRANKVALKVTLPSTRGHVQVHHFLENKIVISCEYTCTHIHLRLTRSQP